MLKINKIDFILNQTILTIFTIFTDSAAVKRLPSLTKGNL